MADATVDLVNRMLRPVARALWSLLRRAAIEDSTDTTRIQTVKVAIGEEVHDPVERFQPYGFSARPLDGAEALLACLGGDPSHAVVIQVEDRRYRLTGLAKGEVAIYSDQGDKVVIRRGGTIQVVASTAVQITSPTVTVSGDLTVTGTVTGGQVKEGSIRLGTHKHTGVTTGGGVSGTPTA